MKSDFDMMTLRELKQYVLKHRNDQPAFEALMDRIDRQPEKQVYGEVNAEEFSTLLEQHRRLKK